MASTTHNEACIGIPIGSPTDVKAVETAEDLKDTKKSSLLAKEVEIDATAGAVIVQEACNNRAGVALLDEPQHGEPISATAVEGGAPRPHAASLGLIRQSKVNGIGSVH